MNICSALTGYCMNLELQDLVRELLLLPVALEFWIQSKVNCHDLNFHQGLLHLIFKCPVVNPMH